MPLLLATEAAAIEACKWLGKNNQNMADQAAVSAMRQKLNTINFSGIIKIGEGERDKAPMLSIGEKVGRCSAEQPTIDIAVDPLEGTSACAKGTHGAMSVIAIANHNCILQAPDVYMQKIVTNEDIDPESVSVNYSVRNNLHAIAMQKEKKIDELKIIVLDRPRHSEIIQQIRQLKASVMLITDGDVAAAISVALGQADAYIGIGGAPEGFLAASAVKCLNGNIQGKLIFDDDQSIARAKAMGISDTNKIYHASDMIMGETLFVASAITSTLDMQPINRENGQLSIESLMMCSENNSITNIQNTYFI